MRSSLFILFFLCCGLAGAAQSGEDSDTAPIWTENEARMPAYPRPDRLVEFMLGPTASNRYYVDPESLSVGEDGVVRYTVVVKSPSGARNVSFEGMRCVDGERKLYAFGHPDGSWSVNRYAGWEPIQVRNPNSYQRELFYHFFCVAQVRRTLPELLRVLKSGGIYPHD